jgi:uncharacterized membrane protein
MARFCTNCGTSMDDNSGFCGKCGHTMGGVTAGGPVLAVPTASAGGLTDNVAGLLAYLLIPAIVFLFVDPYNRNRFVRFHSFQSIFLAVFLFAVNLVLGLLPIIGWAISFLVSIASFALWIVLMVKAYNGQKWKLPVIGDMAEKQANTV